MLESVKHDTIRILSHVKVRREDAAEEEARQRRQAEEMAKRMQFKHESLESPSDEGNEGKSEQTVAAAPITREGPKVGRNDACPCGSGKKYKQCHGKIA